MPTLDQGHGLLGETRSPPELALGQMEPPTERPADPALNGVVHGAHDRDRRLRLAHLAESVRPKGLQRPRRPSIEHEIGQDRAHDRRELEPMT